MKKLIFSFAAAACLAAVCAFAPGGTKSFEGVIEYSIDITSPSLPPEQLAMMAGSKVMMYIKNEKARVETHMGPVQSVSIIDTKTNQSVSLTDVMGQKYMTKINLNDEKAKAATKSEVKYLDGTKEIAGYKCKKAEVTAKLPDGTDTKIEVYYTEDLPYNGSYSNNIINGLKGFPMEYSINTGQYDMVMHYTVKSVTKETVSATKFDIPEGYTEITPEQLKGGQ